MRVSKEFIKYCLVGIINTLVGLTTAYTLLNLFSFSYLASTAAAYIVGIITSFILNKIFTFKDKSENHLQLFTKFALSMLPIYVISYFLGWLTSKIVFSVTFLDNAADKIAGAMLITHDKITDNFAILISMTIYLLLGFFANKFLIFNKKNKPQI